MAAATPPDVATCVSAWLESLLAAQRPELSWTPDSLAAALGWARCVEQHWQNEAVREEMETLSRALPVLCAEGEPTPACARRQFLRNIVRTLRLLHGPSVTPLLCALSSGEEAVLDTVSASVTWLVEHGSARRDACAYFASSSNVAALLASGTTCSSCESERPPHHPSVHLAPAAAAAAYAALLYSGAHASGPDSPALHGKLLAAALCLALRGAAVDEDGHDRGSEPPSPAAAAVLLPAFQPRSREPLLPPPEWLHLPSWLAALSAASLPALTDAYARALIRSHKRGASEVKDAAARLRVLCAVSEGTEARVQAVLEGESCIAKQPLSGAKRKSREEEE